MNSLEFVVSASERNDIFVVCLSECLTDKLQNLISSARLMLLVLTVKALHFHAELVRKDGVEEDAYEGGESQT